MLNQCLLFSGNFVSAGNHPSVVGGNLGGAWYQGKTSTDDFTVFNVFIDVMKLQQMFSSSTLDYC